MNKDTPALLRRICGGSLSISIGLAGVCLMVQCYRIYSMGDHPFSREAVAAAFSPIRVPVLLCLALAVLALVLEAVLPSGEASKSPRQKAMILAALRKKADLTAFDQKEAVLQLQKKRKARQLLTLALTLLGSAVFLFYATREGSFHQSQINGSMVRAMGVLAAAMAPAFGCGLWASIAAEALTEQEITLLKTAPKKAAEPAGKREFPVRYAVLLLAAALLIYGFLTGGTADVLTKAVNICTECVGLG